MDFDAVPLILPRHPGFGVLQHVRIDDGRIGGPAVSVSIARESVDPHGFAVYVNAANGPTLTRARGLTAKAAVRIANLEAALLRSAYAAGDCDARGEGKESWWTAAADALAGQIAANGGGGRTADAVAAAAAANALAEGEGE